LKFLSVTQIGNSNSDRDWHFTAVTKDKHRKGVYLESHNGVIFQTRDFQNLNHIAGILGQTSYATGVLPVFGSVTGLLTPSISPGAIFAVDYTYHCIRKLVPNGLKYRDMQLAGSCRIRGSVDGTANIARLSRPYDLIEDSQARIFFLEKRKIRHLYYENYRWHVKTVKVVDQDIVKMTVHPTANSIYIAFKSSLGVLENNEIRLLTTDLRSGHSDGLLSTAKIQNLEDIVFVNDNVLLFTDQNNHVLRLVNLADNTISTICASPPYGQPESTSVTQCRLRYPHLLQVDANNKLVYVLGADGINKLKYKSK